MNTVEFELANVEPIDYKEFMDTFGTTNTKQIGVQSISSKDAEIQTENQSNYDEKHVQVPCELNYSEIEEHSSIDELIRLRKFLLKAENILNQVITKQRNEISANDLRKFGKLIRLEQQFNQLITFHNYDDSTTFKASNTLIVLWNQNTINQVLYCREKISSCLAVERGAYVLGTENGTILVYDRTTGNQNKSNLNLPDLRIDGLVKDCLISCSFSTLFLSENPHKSRIVQLADVKRDESFKQMIKLLSLDESGIMSIWNLEKVKNLNLSLDNKLGKGMTPLSKFRLNLSESLDFKKILSISDQVFATFELINHTDYLLPVDNEIIYFENNTIKRKFKLTVNLSNSISSVRYNNGTLFLAASSDGTVTLFDVTIVKAIYVWQIPGIIKLNWLNYLCFAVLDSKNKLSIYDLNQQLAEPIQCILDDSK